MSNKPDMIVRSAEGELLEKLEQYEGKKVINKINPTVNDIINSDAPRKDLIVSVEQIDREVSRDVIIERGREISPQEARIHAVSYAISCGTYDKEVEEVLENAAKIAAFIIGDNN